MKRLRNLLLLALVAAAFASFFLGYVFLPYLPPLGYDSAANGSVLACASPSPCPASSSQKTFSVSLKLPAVDRQNKGALADLKVRSAPGTGRVFLQFDSENPLMNPETQESLRIALAVAKQVSGKPLEGKDLFYSFVTGSDVVGGHSAGAALAVASIAVLREEELNPRVLVTGRVSWDGRIGQVGQILAKAEAVKAAGYTKFLVPPGESVQQVQVQECVEKHTPDGFFRECFMTLKEVDIGEETGLNVVEVEDVATAYALMTH